jgi:all-trans-retinol 13,14-reductase
MYLVFKPNSFKYVNSNYYHFQHVERVWKAQEYSDKSWPEAFMISMGVKKGQSEWTDHMTAMTYMNYAEVKKWKNTFNTVSRQADRGESYDAFKREKTELFIDALEKKFPNIRDCIQSVYTSTPLSYRDYIGSDEGAMYGYQKDTQSPMKSFISPKTKIPNLYLTGQSLNMHGVLGVTISGVLTCSHILGREQLMKSIIENLELADE